MYGKDYTDPSGDSTPADPTTTAPTANWWEGPPPKGYTGPWPPPLPPGGKYGPIFGQIIMPPGGTPAKDLPGATNPTDPSKSPYDHPEYWDTTPPPPPPPAPPPGGNGGGAGSIGGILSPFTGVFTPPASKYPLVPPTPEFHPPSYTPPPAFSYENFHAPTAQDALTDPGYKFARDEGQAALERSHAAQGTLNTGGTLKDILAWGGNYAQTRYNDVYNRQADVYGKNRGNAVDTYNTNYKTQFLDPYAFAYKSALDRFAPQMTAYTTQAQAGQRANELDWQHAWDSFNFDYRKFQDQRDSTFDKTYKYVTA
jgi:hypothetical protein